MNIHPIIVHFPIALLIVYAGIEIVSFFSQKRADKLMTTKLVCLWLGVAGSFAALSSGEGAEEIYGKSALIHTHEEFAEKAHMVYVALALFYLAKTYVPMPWKQYRVWTHTGTKMIVTLLAVVWIGLLTIVGALWWAISRGVGVWDPVTDRAVSTFVDSYKDTGTPQPDAWTELGDEENNDIEAQEADEEDKKNQK